MNNRVLREKKAHDEDDVLGQSFKLKQRFSHIMTYPGHLRLFGKVKGAFSLNDKPMKILDYGCGLGDRSFEMATFGHDITGIDLSSNYIKLANTKNIERSFDNISFIEMDAHKLKFNNEAFDLVIGDGILHHLDFEQALIEVRRVLKKGGVAIFKEPLDDNPLLKLFRFLTPKARTVDEAPFSGKDLNKILNHNLWDVKETYFCGLTSSIVAIFTSFFLRNRPQNFLLKLSDKLDLFLNKFKFFNSYNQYVLFHLKKK